jgi:ubiquitin carboxyl-terminal hydrolase 5/13
MGLKNLGNSCYMNSVLQAMWVVPELKSRYLDNIGHIFNTSPPDVANDFLTQVRP